MIWFVIVMFTYTLEQIVNLHAKVPNIFPCENPRQNKFVGLQVCFLYNNIKLFLPEQVPLQGRVLLVHQTPQSRG